MSIVQISHAVIVDDKVEHVKEFLVELVTESLKEKGCLHFQLLQNEENPQEITLIEEWEDQECMDAHFTAVNYETVREKMKIEYKKESSDIRRYVVIA